MGVIGVNYRDEAPDVLKGFLMLIVTCGWGIFQLNSLKAVAVYFKAMLFTLNAPMAYPPLYAFSNISLVVTSGITIIS